MKNVLTVKGSGCVALGHPARPPRWLPRNDGSQGGRRFRTLFRTLAAPKRAEDGGTSKRRRYPRGRGQPEPRARRACQWRTTLPEQCRADAVSKRKKSRQRRALPPATVWSSCSRRKSSREKPSQRKPRFDRVGTATFPARRLFGRRRLAALVVPDPSHSPIIGQAPVPRRRCGADETARRPVVRLHNGQQNAHRRDPSGGDPGGRSARQSRRGIRLRVRTP